MSLPAFDLTYLEDGQVVHQITSDGAMTCVVIAGFRVPLGYDRAQTDLLLRLNPGYPDVPPDMWWFDPPLRRADGQPPEATQVVESYLGRSWQRWSRHLSAEQWRSGVDSLQTFVALIRRELERSAAA